MASQQLHISNYWIFDTCTLVGRLETIIQWLCTNKPLSSVFFCLLVSKPIDSPLLLKPFWLLFLPQYCIFQLGFSCECCLTRKLRSHKLCEAHGALSHVKGTLRHFLAVGQCFYHDILNSLTEMSEIKMDLLCIIHPAY